MGRPPALAAAPKEGARFSSRRVDLIRRGHALFFHLGAGLTRRSSASTASRSASYPQLEELGIGPVRGRRRERFERAAANSFYAATIQGARRPRSAAPQSARQAVVAGGGWSESGDATAAMDGPGGGGIGAGVDAAGGGVGAVGALTTGADG